MFVTTGIYELDNINPWYGFILSAVISIISTVLSIFALIKTKSALAVIVSALSIILMLFTVFAYLLPEAGIPPIIQF